MPEWGPQCPAEYVKTDVVGPLRLLARVFPKSELDSTTFAYVSYVARYTKGSASLPVFPVRHCADAREPALRRSRVDVIRVFARRIFAPEWRGAVTAECRQ